MRFGLILLCAGLLPAQPAPDKCRLEGKVLNSATGAPVRKAQVVLSGMATAGSALASGQAGRALASVRLAATTDGEGRFVFEGLDPGKYTLMTSRAGFQNLATQVRRAEPILLAPAEDKRDLILKIEPLSVISGHVRDEDGDPVRSAQVSVMVYQYTANGRQLATRNTLATNDLGEYRFFDLQPGKYYLGVAVFGGSTLSMPGVNEDTYASVYYPGAADVSSASVIELRPGQEQSGADFTLRRTHTATVSGRLAKPAGASQTTVRLARAEPGSGIAPGGVIVNSQDGFQIRQVLPGSYVLAADTTVGDNGYVARVPVQVAGTDVIDLIVPFVPTFDMNGRVQLEGAPPTGRGGPGAVPPVPFDPPPGARSNGPFSQVMIYMNGRFPQPMIRRTAGGSTTFSSGTAKVNDDGTIVFKDLAPDIYTVSVSVPTALYLKSMRCGNAEIGDAGIDLTGGAACELSVVLSYNGGRIEGGVEDESGQPAASAVLTLVPMGSIRKLALFKTGGVSQQGSFTISGIAPGAYKLYAWEDVDTNAVRYDPDFLKPYEALGQTVQISEGASEHVTVKLIKKPAEP
jgi:protocatechuate 3,4-dioxygenase beta subunit